MNNKNLVVGLDIGTTKVCTIVGEIGERPEIIGVGTHPSLGLKKGSVVNIDKTVQSILGSLEEAKLMSGANISKATIGIAGGHIYSFNSSGVVAVKNKYIEQSDIDRVLEATRAVVIPSDREILHVIPQEFKVDNTGGMNNPLGMAGIRLEAHAHVVTGSMSLIKNLVKCVELSGITAEQIVLQPVASSEAVLTEEEKEMGVVLVDIGGGTTDIAIWKNGSLVHTQVIPVGGNHFTNDLAVALRVPHNEAERIKVHHGSVLSEEVNQSAHITVQGIIGTASREVPLATVATVLGSRAEELFLLVNDIIKSKGMESLVGGIVFTGGGSLIRGIKTLGEYIFEMPTKIGHPLPLGGMTNVVQNPKFSTVIGLLLHAVKVNHENVDFLKSGLFNNFTESLKSIFREIF